MVYLEVLLGVRVINYCFNLNKISKMGMVCIVYEKISGGSAPKFPLDPPLVTEVANVDSTDIDADSSMKSTN